MAEREPKNARETSLPTAAQGRLENVQKFLHHTLSCVDPECLLPHCVNMKLALKHIQGCKKADCSVCQQMKSLASKHSESCADFYCCMPYCMEAKLRGFVHSHFSQIEGCLDAGSQSQKEGAVPAVESSSSSRNQDGLSNAFGRSVKETTTRQIIEERPPFNLSSSNESTPDQTTSTQQEFSLLRTNSYPQVNLKRINRSASLNTPATYAKSPRLQSEHRRCKSLVKQNSVTATSQWDPFMEPIPASREEPLTARTQTVPNPLFAVKGRRMPENVATKQQSLKANASTSTVQSENALSQQASQSTDIEIQKTTDLFNTACLSSVAEASHSAPRATDISGHVTRDSRTLLKARLIHTLYHLLHLIMQKLETREEILLCIKSLRNALHEIKTLQ